MFTGIVQAKGRVVEVRPHPFGVRLRVDRSAWRPPRGYQPEHGDSICVSGVCLTVTEASGDLLAFDVIAETLSRTTLGSLAEGDEVNLEPAVMADQPLGGHFMQGHVDGVGEITDVRSDEVEWRVEVRPPREVMDYLTPKGSVAIDGVSLTLAAVGEASFQVALIPTTLAMTTLAERKAGDRVNLEADMLAKTVVHHLRRMREGPQRDNEEGERGEGVTMDLLRRAGFAGLTDARSGASP